jgi:hypothetical protein
LDVSLVIPSLAISGDGCNCHSNGQDSNLFAAKKPISHIIYIPVSKRSTLFFLFGPVRMKKNRSTR